MATMMRLVVAVIVGLHDPSWRGPHGLVLVVALVTAA